MHSDYFKAALPDPYRILGVELLPLSLGRYRLLERFECAFVADEEEHVIASSAGLRATSSDLLLGVLICSMRVKDFLELLGSDRLERELRTWGQRIKQEMEADDFFSLPEKFGLFAAYIDESCQLPRYWEENPESGESGSHWSHSLEVALRSELGYTPEEIEEGPLAKALLDYFKHAENKGVLRLVSDDEIEDGNANAERLAAVLKGAPCLA